MFAFGVLTSAVLLATVLLASITDVLEQKIYNVLTFPVFLFGVASHLVAGAAWWEGIAGAAVAGAPHFLLWLFGVQKAADVKLLMAVGALGGLFFGAAVAVLSIVFGGALSLFALLLAGRLGDVLRIASPRWGPSRSLKAPFGVAIAAATLAILLFLELQS